MCFKINSYGLTVTGLSCTIIAFLIMTDWQAIGSDPCTAYSLFHHPQLASYYRLQLKDSYNVSEVLAQAQTRDSHLNWCSTGDSIKSHSYKQDTIATCAPVRGCTSQSEHSQAQLLVSYSVYYNKHDDICFNGTQTYQGLATEGFHKTNTATILCTSGKKEMSSCFFLSDMQWSNSSSSNSSSIDKSLVAAVHVQSLTVVEGTVYQMAVNRCEAAGKYCHWIPNSRVTKKHCSDCQPICRDTRRTLNVVQFVAGLTFLFSTLALLYTGAFLLLSETVSTSYQVYNIHIHYTCKNVYSHLYSCTGSKYGVTGGCHWPHESHFSTLE